MEKQEKKKALRQIVNYVIGVQIQVVKNILKVKQNYVRQQSSDAQWYRYYATQLEFILFGNAIVRR